MSKPTKTAEQYSHDIKLLKYYMEEAIKENNTLKYQLKQVERDKKMTAKSSGIISDKLRKGLHSEDVQDQRSDKEDV